MIVPLVMTRVKKFGNRVCLRINPCQICPFVQIAIDAGQCEIIEVVAAAMYLWNDVLDVKDSQWWSLW
jgi:hypothetical protein